MERGAQETRGSGERWREEARGGEEERHARLERGEGIKDDLLLVPMKVQGHTMHIVLLHVLAEMAHRRFDIGDIAGGGSL
jgi:hypothetical protein